jgi:hypothetical protein
MGASSFVVLLSRESTATGLLHYFAGGLKVRMGAEVPNRTGNVEVLKDQSATRRGY